MNKPAKISGTETVENVLDKLDARTAGLARLREPFPESAISKLPKPTKTQTDEVKADFKKGIRCKECGAWHHPNVVHLDYVGHAALTDRLLKVDPEWSWEPVAYGPNGLPVLDANGGLWIRLTILGVTRLGYGDAEGKTGGNAIKEAIGDALRNAGMRFGAALDLWSKGDLHADNEDRSGPKPIVVVPKHDEPSPFINDEQRDRIAMLAEAADIPVKKICDGYGIDNLTQLHADEFAKCTAKLRKLAEARSPAPAGDVLDDEIPY